MEVIRRYRTETAWYAQVDIGDQIIEVKLRAEEEPADVDFLAVAAQVQESLNSELSFVVEAEDGTQIE